MVKQLATQGRAGMGLPQPLGVVLTLLEGGWDNVSLVDVDVLPSLDEIAPESPEGQCGEFDPPELFFVW